jgi:23S rRNA-intervening sequence protein
MKNTPSTQSTVAPASDSAPMLDAERLDVYAVALQFQALATVLASRADCIVRDQLRRASLSCVLNIAEGAGQRSRPQKRALLCHRTRLGDGMRSRPRCPALEPVRIVRGAARGPLIARADGADAHPIGSEPRLRIAASDGTVVPAGRCDRARACRPISRLSIWTTRTRRPRPSRWVAGERTPRASSRSRTAAHSRALPRAMLKK